MLIYLPIDFKYMTAWCFTSRQGGDVCSHLLYLAVGYHSGPAIYIYIYTKALPDRIFSSVRGSTILRVKPGLQVRIFYLFKMSSKMLISRIYMCIYIRNRWYFELINYGNISPNLHDFKLNYSICWIRCIYIHIHEEWTSTISTISY